VAANFIYFSIILVSQLCLFFEISFLWKNDLISSLHVRFWVPGNQVEVIFFKPKNSRAPDTFFFFHFNLILVSGFLQDVVLTEL
jgi:hypothetical protein